MIEFRPSHLIIKVKRNVIWTERENMKTTKPSLVLRNGSIYPLDAKRTWAQAIAIAGDKIVYVGTDDGVELFIESDTIVIDLERQMVLPGFVDAHAHPTSSMDYFNNINLHNLNTKEDLIKTISEYVANHPRTEIIRGSGWDNTTFPGIGPGKEILDAIEPDRPVSLTSSDGHSLWVNSKALELAHITRETPHPSGGIIEHSADSVEPNGTLRESAMKLIERVLPPHSLEDCVQALSAYQNMAGQFGITLVHDAMINPLGIQALNQLQVEGRLKMRFRGAITMDPEQGLDQIDMLLNTRSENTHLLFQVNTAKIFIDGVIEGGTGYLLEPYEHMPGCRGEPLWEEERLKALCITLDREGLQIHMHAIGDAATHIALNALEVAQKTNGVRDSRHLITHLQLVSPDDIPRFKELGVVGVPQPFWFQIDEYYSELAVPYLGKRRADQQYPMGSLLDAGVVMASSSDFPVTVPCNPLNGVQQGVTRSNPHSTGGEVLWEEERASLEDMLASYTLSGAYANFLEGTTGSLETGKQADLIVLDQNLFEIPDTEIRETDVLMTLVNGETVYRAPGI